MVSPDYLKPIIKQAKKFSFRVQGYGDFEKARIGLTKTNSKDILGFILISSQPFENTRDMYRFIHSCDLISNKDKRMIIAIQQNKNNSYSAVTSARNLKITEIYDFEILTDIFIKKSLFGAILKEKFAPYEFTPISEVPVTSNRAVLQYRPLFTNSTFSCLSSVLDYGGIEKTIESDTVLKELNSAILKDIRRKRIYKYFGEDITVNVDDFVNDLSAEEYCTLLSLTSIIDEMEGGS